jgi:hypothetical protein
MNGIEELVRRSVRSAAPPAPLAPWREIERRARLERRPRWIRRGFALAALAVALAGALLFGGSTNGSGPSPLERASAAVADWQPNQILYVRQLMVSHFAQPDQVGESWQLTSPPYTSRVRSEFPAGGTAFESATNATGFGQGYDWRTNQVIQTADVHPDWRPTGVEQATRDELQSWLESSHARSLGPSEVDGHHVVGFEAFGHQRIFLDAETYLPVLSQSYGLGSGDERLGYDIHYTWKVLPATPGNMGLLDVSSGHADAAVVNLSGDAWRKQEFELGRLVPALTVPGG